MKIRSGENSVFHFWTLSFPCKRAWIEQILFFKNKIHSQYQKHKADQVIHPEAFVFEKKHSKQGKNRERDHFLYDFQLPQVERTAIFRIAHSVGRHLKDIFKKGDAPTDQNDAHQSETAEPVHFLEFQMPVPRKCHKGIGEDQKQYSEKAVVHTFNKKVQK